jgi:hypothetical protein
MLGCFFDNLTNLVTAIIEISVITNRSEANTIVAILKEFSEFDASLVVYPLGNLDLYDVSYTN